MRNSMQNTHMTSKLPETTIEEKRDLNPTWDRKEITIEHMKSK